MKKIILVVSTSSFVFLTGCMNTEARIETAFLEYSQQNDEGYSQYLMMQEEGNLDEEGNYYQLEFQSKSLENVENVKPVHITFWDNSYLNIQYYYDEACTMPIDTKECYLDYGESIYATKPKVVRANIDNYSFSSYQIWNYDAEGEQTIENIVDNATGLIFTAPNQPDITEYSIEPVGTFVTNTLSFSSVVVDSNENRVESVGKWRVNGEECADTVEVSTAVPYSVAYSYDENEYYYHASQPECVSYTDYQGVVYFEEVSGGASAMDYFVELCPYKMLTINSDKGFTSLSVNGATKSLTNLSLKKLKASDEVIITTGHDYKVVCNQLDLELILKTDSQNQFRFIVPENESELQLNIEKWTTREVTVETPKYPWWEKLWNWKKENHQNYNLLSANTGTRTFSYEQLQQRSGIPVSLRECDELNISVEELMKNEYHFRYVIAVGSQKTYIDRFSDLDERNVNFTYEQLASISSIKIDAEQGFAFSPTEIASYNSDELSVHYIVDGKEITENIFLALNTKVDVVVDNVPVGKKLDDTPVAQNKSVIISENTVPDDFAVRIKEDNNTFQFKIGDYSVEHGKVTFSRNGQPLEEDTILPKGTRLEYQITADEGYWSPEPNGVVVVTSDYDTQVEIKEKLIIYRQETITVHLAQPEYGGIIHYFIDEIEVKGQSVQLQSGTEIMKTYVAQSGWYTNKPQAEKVIAKENGQEIEPAVNSIFAENTEYMPHLKVTYDKNISGGIAFYVDADWLTGDSGANSNKRIACDSKIRTGENQFTLISRNGAPIEGKSLKIEITKKYRKDTKRKDVEIIRYVTKDQIPMNEQIEIYENNNRISLIQEIEVKISQVQIATYFPKLIPNGVVRVQFADRAEETLLREEEVIETNRKVIVSIIPNDGWRVTGKGISNNQYQETMKYSDYIKNISKILENHPVERIFHVTLASSDSYGVCTYKLNGNPVSGTITYIEGDKLEMTYEVTDSRFKIRYDGAVSNLLGNKTKQTKEIKLSILHNDSTVDRRNFDIQINIK